MRSSLRLPWSPPSTPDAARELAGLVLLAAPGEPWGHLVCMCNQWRRREEEEPLEVIAWDPVTARFGAGELEGKSPNDVAEGLILPALYDIQGERIVCDDPIEVARALAPQLFDEGARSQLESLRENLVDAAYRLGEERDQASYERAHALLAASIEVIDEELQDARYLGGDEVSVADLFLFTFTVRFESVYYELYKATTGVLANYPCLLDHARDLYEDAAVHQTTDFDAIKKTHYLCQPVLNPSGIIPRGGIPDLDAPHFRAAWFDQRGEGGVGEDQSRARSAGEWVRPPSEERAWIRADGAGDYPAEAGRYHLYAPYNCPWSHRALLARAVKGLEDVVGASIVYFRRDPERGWQFNPSIPGCTEDRVGQVRYIEELYHAVGSSERSVPLLWDTVSETIVSNESADILRMFNDAFGALATREIDLYPAEHRVTIDRMNEMIYQRINNGAYKAGFTNSQRAYERAFARYFRALDWLEDWLDEKEWIAHSPAPTEADLRLFPTLFRHDAVYYSRFKLNHRTIASYPRLRDWLERMMQVPGVREASNMDHARNGYFGRSGNQLVPAGPIPLTLSPSQFDRATWLNLPTARRDSAEEE